MLNVIRMSKNDIKKLKLVKNGNCGTTSKVYKLNDKECIKVFNNYMDEFDLYRMNRFTEMSFEGANLPKVLVLINNKFKASIMDYINGEMLSELTSIDYSTFIRIANELVQNVKIISEERIRIFDSHTENIMYNYDTGKLVLTDPGEWSFDTLNTKEEITRKNFELINSSIRGHLFMTDSYLPSCFYIPNLVDISVDDDFIDYYEDLKEKIEKTKNVKIKTILDSRRYM
ncbi:MAG: hypothetical protein ACI4OG_01585 [Bacilli bacterium]